MKSSIILITGLLLLFCSKLSSKNIETISNRSLDDSITVLSSPDLYNLTMTWAKEYSGYNPKTKINVIKVADSQKDKLNKNSNLSFLSHDYAELKNESVWKIVVGRDIIVPVINSKNPFLDEIYEKGISSAEIALIFSNPDMRKWGTLLENKQNIPVKYYLINNETLKANVANFLNTDPVTINGIIVESGKELVSAVQKDIYSIGFCKMIDIIDFTDNQIVNNIKLMPIDRNGNGKIDYNEKIYDDLNVFARGVWIGKYPKILYNNIYSLSSAQPTNEAEVAFLKWVLTEGQQFVHSGGYSDLAYTEQQTKVNDLVVSRIDLASTNNTNNILKIVLFILAGLLVAGFIMDAVIRFLKRKKVQALNSSVFSPVFNEDSVTWLNGLYFDKTHTWAFMEKDGIVKLGIDDFLQHITGSITQVKLKNTGEKIEKGEPFLSIIRKGKQLNINAPVSGIIKEQNLLLKTNSSLLNTSPYSDGWVYKIEPSNWLREIRFLTMAEKYKIWLKYEFSRLKDFLSIFVKPGTAEYSHVILQDGGELKDNLLADLGPEVWEEFQTNFIDTSI